MKSSIQIGKIIGIPIKIHFTFIFILALFAWSFSTDSVTVLTFILGYGALPINLILKIILGILLAVLLFVCVLLHEVGHSYITQKFGYKINGITLFIFGGVSEAEEIPHNPKMELKIAVIGPVISILLGFLFYVLYFLINDFNTSLVFQILSITVGTLAFYNLVLGLFNLIPAFPIDGGRILRSVLASQMEYGRATKIASNIGKGFAIAIAVFGIFFNLWLVLIAVFVYIGATQEDKALQISIALESYKVKDLMTPQIDSVSPMMTLKDFSDHMLKHKHLGYPVMENDNVLGMMTINELHKVEKEKQDSILVENVMKKDFFSISPEEPAVSAFKIMMKNNHERIIVQQKEMFRGIISWSDLLRVMRMQNV